MAEDPMIPPSEDVQLQPYSDAFHEAMRELADEASVPYGVLNPEQAALDAALVALDPNTEG